MSRRDYENSEERTSDINLENGVIYLAGVVTEDEAGRIASSIKYLADKYAEREIRIYINSPGGSITAGDKIVMEMEDHPEIPFVTIAQGHCASMGAYILCAGHLRMAHEDSSIMCHQASLSISENTQLNVRDLDNMYQHLKKTNDRLVNKQASRLKISKEDFESRFEYSDYEFDAKTALEIGFIDVILPTATKDHIEENKKKLLEKYKLSSGK